MVSTEIFSPDLPRVRYSTESDPTQPRSALPIASRASGTTCSANMPRLPFPVRRRPEDEGVHLLVFIEIGQRVHPALRRAVERPLVLVGYQPHHVVQPGDLVRVAARGQRGVVDDAVQPGQPLRRDVGRGYRPAIRLRADQRHRPRPAHAEPQPDRVRGRRAGLHVRGRIAAALEAVRRTGPAGPDDVDRLAERGDRLGRGAPRAAHPGDAVAERARAQAELEPPAAEHVDGGRLLGQHGRRPERQVGHVGEEVHPAGPRGQPGDQAERVHEARRCTGDPGCRRTPGRLRRRWPRSARRWPGRRSWDRRSGRTRLAVP